MDKQYRNVNDQTVESFYRDMFAVFDLLMSNVKNHKSIELKNDVN